MFQHPCQAWRDRIQSLQWNAKFAVVECADPGRLLGDVEECLIGVENHLNTRARSASECVGKFFVIGFERREQLIAKCARTLRALVMKNKVSSFALRLSAFRRRFPFRPGNYLLN